MRNFPLILFGKTFSKVSKSLNRGNGSTWPGHIALKGNHHFVQHILAKSPTKIIIVAGTNGKTTTSSLIASSLQKQGRKVLQNESGANLLNGIASTLLLHADKFGRITHDYAIFEVDENALPQVLAQVTPDYLVLLNLFRDQLDRYGELNTIATKWGLAIHKLTKRTKLVLNADDPQIAYLAEAQHSPRNAVFFGLESPPHASQKIQQAADSISCPRCGTKLDFKTVTFSHLGVWSCPSCLLRRPKADITTYATSPLTGMYNRYNTHAAVLVLQVLGLSSKQIEQSMKAFRPAFGRQEVITYKNKKVQLFLSKNPTSFNQSFATIKEAQARTLLIILNDRIPDGRDVSWIWDTDLTGSEMINHIVISGDRTYDMALRVQYEHNVPWKMDHEKWKIEPNLRKAIEYALTKTEDKQTLYILPTYSAMLEARKILTGKKIL